jgi:dephospho-CoA kinase
MKKQIFIVNGMGGCGKDTFAEFLGEFHPVFKYSSIDRVKQIAYECGWNGSKSEKDRKFLSDLKCLLTEYNDLPFTDVENRVNEFLYEEYARVMLIDIREPKEIERAKVAYGAKTILIKNDRIPFISSNMADAGVYNYTYDYILENNGTLEDFRETVRAFAEQIG